MRINQVEAAVYKDRGKHTCMSLETTFIKVI